MSGQIAINEFNSQRGFTDENGEDVDWVEVFNYSNSAVSLDSREQAAKLKVDALNKNSFNNFI